MWDEITYLFPNFNISVDVLEWISNFTPYFMVDVITYPCWDLKIIHVSKSHLWYVNGTGTWKGSKQIYYGSTHWGRATHICVSKLTIIGSDNGLTPGRRQAIIWTNAGILLIRTLGTNFSEIFSEIHTFLFKKMHLKMSSGKWRPSCLGLNVLRKYRNDMRTLVFETAIYGMDK